MAGFRCTGAVVRALFGWSALCLVVGFLALWPQPAWAATINVDNVGCNLPDAITAANTDAPAGGCNPGSGADTLVLSPTVYSLTVLDNDTDGANGTPDITSTIIISGVPGSIVQRSGVLPMRLFHVAASGNLTIKHLLMRNGKSSGISSGGAILNLGILSVAESEFFSNTAGDSGGAIYDTGSGSATIAATDFISNFAQFGGAIWHGTGPLTITGGEFRANRAPIGGGGAIYNLSGLFNLAHSTIISNSAPSAQGGGIYISAGTANITDANVISNSAAFGGGFVIQQGSTVNLLDSHVLSNTAAGSCGGFYVIGSVVHLTGSQVNANQAKGVVGIGGGLCLLQNATVMMTSTEVSFNKAQGIGSGGAIYNNGSTLHAFQSKINANQSVNGSGGGIDNIAGTAILTATEVLSNSAPNGGGIENEQSSTLKLTGVHLRANHATGTGLTNGGGALFNHSGATAEISDSDFLTNTTASNGGAIYDQNNSSTTITATDFISNFAQADGGAIAHDKSALTITGGEFRANRAQNGHGGAIFIESGPFNLAHNTIIANSTAGGGGGIYIIVSTGNITGANVISNSAGFGGGFVILSGGPVNVLDSHVLSNTAVDCGGFDIDSSITNLIGSQVHANHATGKGGGLCLNLNAIVMMTSTEVSLNKAQSDGGGISNQRGTLHAYQSKINANQAVNGNGGGLANQFFGGVASTAILTATEVLSNSAVGGGGIDSNQSTLKLTGVHLRANHASSLGGGLFNHVQATATINGSDFLSNTATTNGGAIEQDTTSQTTVQQSCIVNNSDLAVNNEGSNPLVATSNWWGSPDGPSGVSSGAGDSVSAHVSFTPFLTTAPAGCPTLTAQVSISKVRSPLGTLLPGQPLIFTVAITNNDDKTVKNLYVHDLLPATFVLSSTSSSGPVSSLTTSGLHSSFVITQLLPAQVVKVFYTGAISGDLTSALTLTNTATLTNGLIGTRIVKAVVPVVVPTLGWSSPTYHTGEGAGSTVVTVTLTPPTPYTTVQVQVIYTDSAGSLSVQAVQNVNFPPGSSSQQVTIPISNDQGVGARSISLSLQSPQRAHLNSAGATIIINENDVDSLTVDKRADRSQAAAGDTIVYSYRITNTGTVMLTMAARDNRLGNVVGLAGALAPGATVSATLTYKVKASDAVGPLVNTVTVTGTDALNSQVVKSASASVNIVAVAPQPLPGLSVKKSVNATHAAAGDLLTYTYLVTNTGNVSLTLTATDDHLGKVTGLELLLAPGQQQSATMTYTVQASDPVGKSLTNKVTVTGSDPDNVNITTTSTTQASVIIDGPAGHKVYLPQIDK